MIHHAVKCVIEACLFIQDVDWLDASIIGITIERFKEKQANVTVLTVISIPNLSFVFAACVLASDIRTASTYKLECTSGVGRRDPVPNCAQEAQNNIFWSCTGPLTTVRYVRPAPRGILEPNKRLFVHVSKFATCELVHRDLV